MVLNSKPISVLPNPDAVVQLPSNESGFVLHQKGRRHYWEGTGLLSIKSFYGGQAFYNTGKGLYAVNDSSYLVLNDRQPYSITIESERAVESFCLFFKAELAEDVFRSLNSKPEKLLDNPTALAPQSKINFFDKLTRTTVFFHHLCCLSNHHSPSGKINRAGTF